jgi:hypothetical protein
MPGIPSRDHVSFIIETRDQVWKVAPYPSVAGLAWVNPYITLHSSYNYILQKLQNSNDINIMDCGCLIATVLHYLASKGVNSRKMIGFDIEERFFDIWVRLFPRS